MKNELWAVSPVTEADGQLLGESFAEGRFPRAWRPVQQYGSVECHEVGVHSLLPKVKRRRRVLQQLLLDALQPGFRVKISNGTTPGRQEHYKAVKVGGFLCH